MTTTTVAVDVRLFRVEITATTEVPAPAERTWAVLTDTGAYPQWNPFVRRLTGRLAVVETIEVDLQADQSPLTPFFRKLLTGNTPQAFVALNEALVARATADR